MFICFSILYFPLPYCLYCLSIFSILFLSHFFKFVSRSSSSFPKLLFLSFNLQSYFLLYFSFLLNQVSLTISFTLSLSVFYLDLFRIVSLVSLVFFLYIFYSIWGSTFLQLSLFLFLSPKFFSVTVLLYLLSSHSLSLSFPPTLPFL